MPEDAAKRLARRKARQASDPEAWREMRRRTTRAWRKRIKDLIKLYKDYPCMDCGIRYPHWVMDFDHVRGEKKFDLSRWEQAKVPSRMTREKMIEEEVSKCDVVCANCHRLRHPPTAGY